MDKNTINVKEENLILLAIELKQKNEKAFIALKTYMDSVKKQDI